jgi:sigma-B regulation protein RsbU (phosphoserine phosphatase)
VEARYAALTVLLWEPSTLQIVVANAGAIPPMICRGSEILKVRAEGVPVGLLECREYEEITFQTEPGDTIVLYSDGITDHQSPAGGEFGRGRLSKVVRSGCRLPAAGLIESIFAELDKFNTTAFDDQTVFVMKVK